MRSIVSFVLIVISCSLMQAQELNSFKDSVFNVVDNPPKYPGGDEALMTFLRDNINYPQEAREKNIQGTVYVSFIVETDGSVSGIKILRGIGGGCDEESLRVVGLMPKWSPGYHKGEVVRVQFNLPIRYVLTGPHFSLKKKKRK